MDDRDSLSALKKYLCTQNEQLLTDKMLPKLSMIDLAIVKDNLLVNYGRTWNQARDVEEEKLTFCDL